MLDFALTRKSTQIVSTLGQGWIEVKVQILLVDKLGSRLKAIKAHAINFAHL